MADPGIALAAIVLLLVVVAGSVTVFARDSTRTAEGFFLAGRNIGSSASASAISGECVTAALLVSLVAFAYGLGFDAALLVAGVAGGLGVALFVASALRRSGCYTIVGFAYVRFGSDRIRLVAVIALLLASLCYLVPLAYSAGTVWILLGDTRVPGLTPYGTGVIIAGLVSALLAVVSGMKGTTLNQAAQFVGLGMAALAVLASALLAGQVVQSDGLKGAPGRTADPPIAASNQVTGDRDVPSEDAAGGSTTLNRLSLLLSLAFGVAGMPHILARYGANRSGPAARRSVIWALVLVCALASVASVAGLLARTPSGQWRSGSPHLDAVPVEGPAAVASGLAATFGILAGEPWMIGVLAAVLFAVVSSSVAGVLVAVASAVGYDIYGAYVDPHASDDRKILVGRVAMIGFVVLSVGAALALPEAELAIDHQALITFMAASAFSVASAAFLPVLIAGIGWKRSTERGALAGMIVGGGGSALFVLASTLAQFGYVRAEGVLAFVGSLAFPTVLTFPAALCAILVVSAVDGQLPKNLDEVWHTIHGAPGRLGREDARSPSAMREGVRDLGNEPRHAGEVLGGQIESEYRPSAASQGHEVALGLRPEESRE